MDESIRQRDNTPAENDAICQVADGLNTLHNMPGRLPVYTGVIDFPGFKMPVAISISGDNITLSATFQR